MFLGFFGESKQRTSKHLVQIEDVSPHQMLSRAGRAVVVCLNITGGLPPQCSAPWRHTVEHCPEPGVRRQAYQLTGESLQSKFGFPLNKSSQQKTGINQPGMLDRSDEYFPVTIHPPSVFTWRKI